MYRTPLAVSGAIGGAQLVEVIVGCGTANGPSNGRSNCPFDRGPIVSTPACSAITVSSSKFTLSPAISALGQNYGFLLTVS